MSSNIQAFLHLSDSARCICGATLSNHTDPETKNLRSYFGCPTFIHNIDLLCECGHPGNSHKSKSMCKCPGLGLTCSEKECKSCHHFKLKKIEKPEKKRKMYSSEFTSPSSEKKDENTTPAYFLLKFRNGRLPYRMFYKIASFSHQMTLKDSTYKPLTFAELNVEYPDHESSNQESTSIYFKSSCSLEVMGPLFDKLLTTDANSVDLDILKEGSIYDLVRLD